MLVDQGDRRMLLPMLQPRWLVMVVPAMLMWQRLLVWLLVQLWQHKEAHYRMWQMLPRRPPKLQERLTKRLLRWLEKLSGQRCWREGRVESMLLRQLGKQQEMLEARWLHRVVLLVRRSCRVVGLQQRLVLRQRRQ